MGILSRLEARLHGRRRVPWVLYTRPGCTLCDELVEALGKLALVQPDRIRLVNVDLDRNLKKRHGLRLPVLEVGGREVFAGRYQAGQGRELVRAALSAARAWRPSR